MPKTYPEFAQWLDNALAARRMKPAGLARALDVDPAVVSKWRQGRTPTIENLQVLADYFGVERVLLEPLIGLRASTLGGVQSLLSQEDQAEAAEFHAFMERMRREVPREFWSSYRKAVNAISEPYIAMKELVPTPPTAPTPGTRRSGNNTHKRAGANEIGDKSSDVAQAPTDQLSQDDNRLLTGPRSGVLVLIAERRAHSRTGKVAA